MARGDGALSSFTIVRVSPERTHRLRADVLHGGAPPQVARVPGEDDPGAVTFAALDADGTVVGCVGLFPQTCPDLPDHDGAGWRLRRLATAPRWERRGVGTRVVEAALEHAADQGGGVAWCNATPAGAVLFDRLGFVRTGEPWEDPEFGANVRMWRTV